MVNCQIQSKSLLVLLKKSDNPYPLLFEGAGGGGGGLEGRLVVERGGWGRVLLNHLNHTIELNLKSKLRINSSW